MTTLTNQKFNVSTYLSVAGDFSSFSDDLEVLNNVIIINGQECIVESIETDLNKEFLELYINIPVVARDEIEAEELAQLLLDEANSLTINLIDLEQQEGCILKIAEPNFMKAEYYIA